MRQRIFKYELKFGVGNVLKLPANYSILRVGLDMGRQKCLWAAVFPKETQMSEFRYRLFSTDEELPELYEYVGTIDDNGYMWHVCQVYA